MKQRRPGRPTKLTTDIIREIERLLTLGLSRARACAFVRISHDSLSIWCKRDKELAELLEKAEIAGEIEHLENIRSIAIGEKKGDYRASAWFLGRKFPAQWSEKAEVSAANSDNETFAFRILPLKPVSEMSDEELAEELSKHRAILKKLDATDVAKGLIEKRSGQTDYSTKLEELRQQRTNRTRQDASSEATKGNDG